MHPLDISVLLITFNRPETTQKVLKRILEAQPRHLFIFSDGPRKGVEGEDKLIKRCRRMFDEIDTSWDCQLEKIFLEKNLGCGRGVSHAINKAFKKVDKLIILEDDCLPHPSFFNYSKIMLEKYEHMERVMHVSGTRWNDEFNIGKGDHFFSHIGHIWGWATWKRAWEKYDYHMPFWKSFDRDEIARRFKSKGIGEFWTKKFDYSINNLEKLNTWDYQWQFCMFASNGVAINPDKNLIKNIGVEGAHASGISSNLFRAVFKWENRHFVPWDIKPNLEFDQYHMKNHFMRNKPILKRLLNKIKKIFLRCI